MSKRYGRTDYTDRVMTAEEVVEFLADIHAGTDTCPLCTEEELCGLHWEDQEWISRERVIRYLTAMAGHDPNRVERTERDTFRLRGTAEPWTARGYTPAPIRLTDWERTAPPGRMFRPPSFGRRIREWIGLKGGWEAEGYRAMERRWYPNPNLGKRLPDGDIDRNLGDWITLPVPGSRTSRSRTGQRGGSTVSTRQGPPSYGARPVSARERSWQRSRRKW